DGCGNQRPALWRQPRRRGRLAGRCNRDVKPRPLAIPQGPTHFYQRKIFMKAQQSETPLVQKLEEEQKRKEAEFRRFVLAVEAASDKALPSFVVAAMVTL